MGDVHQLSDDDPGGRSQELAALLSAFGVRMHLGRPTLRFLRVGLALPIHDSVNETARRHGIIVILA